ncbi:hypothetical protein BBK36DRAFT_1143936 [Trichoderma citrinoviride]|uniref:Uncharacterized protein n=1 Tax=Trichoderma citrinoviride TaxID=58853 RepID=A0A2T4B2A8_9HYPO|nr:hypothetical protein BBK36DRAFT_1143936 [Trichoderma citrinoviride]PTB63456.1 hypothetical protein BBK36DRAFT_1143936 [Trichoderma citrinoviride]
MSLFVHGRPPKGISLLVRDWQGRFSSHLKPRDVDVVIMYEAAITALQLRMSAETVLGSGAAGTDGRLLLQHMVVIEEAGPRHRGQRGEGVVVLVQDWHGTQPVCDASACLRKLDAHFDYQFKRPGCRAGTQTGRHQGRLLNNAFDFQASQQQHGSRWAQPLRRSSCWYQTGRPPSDISILGFLGCHERQWVGGFGPLPLDAEFQLAPLQFRAVGRWRIRVLCWYETGRGLDRGHDWWTTVLKGITKLRYLA